MKIKYCYTCPESGSWFISERGNLINGTDHIKAFASPQIAADWAYQFAQSKILKATAGNIHKDDPLHQLLLEVAEEVLNHDSEQMKKLLLHSENKAVLTLANQIANLTEGIKDLQNWQLCADGECE